MLSCLFAMCLTVTSVTDGDTFHAGETRVRIWGIDAPERSDPGGSDATQALREMIDGARLVCEHVDTDRYGRTVARCDLDGRDIACEMVRQGHARDWPRYSGGRYERC